MKKIIAEKKQKAEEEKKVEKKDKRKKSVKKRKSIKKQDVISRWSGAILFVVVMFVGFLLWVSGEVNNEGVMKAPVERSSRQVVPQGAQVGGQGRVVIE